MHPQLTGAPYTHDSDRKGEHIGVQDSNRCVLLDLYQPQLKTQRKDPPMPLEGTGGVGRYMRDSQNSAISQKYAR